MDELDIARTIVAGLPDPAVLLDRDLKILAYNARFFDLTGVRRRAFEAGLREMSSPLALLGQVDDVERQHAEICLRTRKPITLAEVEVRTPAGAAVTLQITIIPVLGPDGVPVALLQNMRDVTAEVRVQARYHELLAVERLRAEHLEREVEKRTRELTAALEQVTRLSREDPLTGLLNRRAFTEHAELALKLARRHERSVGLLVSDLDFFKKVNDTYGHVTGDAVLVETARALKTAFRDTDAIARFGGEEFVVMLTETAGETIAMIGNRLREMIERLGSSTPIPGVRFPTMSIGMAVYPEHGETLDELISSADEALYQAKELGRNRVVLFDPRVRRVTSPLTRPEQRPQLVALTPAATADDVAGLAEIYEVSAVASIDELLERCRGQRIDAVLCDMPGVELEHAIDGLRRSLRLRPEAVRILVIDDEDEFVELRGANVARVDCFLLRRQAPGNLLAAIDHALSRRELDRQRMLIDQDDVRGYTARLPELAALLDECRLRMAFQPIVDPRTGAVLGHEAFARADHPVFRNATVLFEAAVQSGYLWRLGRMCREMAVATQPEQPPAGKLFLNLHSGELDDPELVGRLGQFGDADRIVFEVAERAAIPDLRRFRATAHALTGRGVEFAVDDLGAGFGDLDAVAMLGPTFLKINMALVRGVDISPRKQELIGKLVEHANRAGIRVVAEGVETKGEASCVAALGCHYAQGFFLGPPRERTLEGWIVDAAPDS